MTGVIYARYSSDNQREESIDGQIRECQAFAKRNNITLLEPYIDRALSAKTDNRPNFQKMIKDSACKAFDVVIVWKLDRFARNRYDSAHYKSLLRKNGVKVLSATEIISAGAEGILLELLLEGMAEYYSAELSEKVTRGHMGNAYKCKHNGGAVPIGYELDENQCYIIDDNVAPIVIQAFEKYADGSTMHEITTFMNIAGVRTKRAGKITINCVSRMLHKRKYIGEYQYKNVVIPNGMPAIISLELFEKVQERCVKNKKSSARHKAEDEYLLTTKLFCGYCKNMMIGESGTSKNKTLYRYYKCVRAKKSGECKKKTVKKLWIEELVITKIREVLFDAEMLDKLADEILIELGSKNNNIPLIQKNIAIVQKGIDNILTAIQMGIFTPSTKAKLEELEAEKSELSIQLLKEEMSKPKLTKEQILFYLERFRKLNPNLLEHRRRLIDSFVNAIYLFDDKITILFNYKDGTQTVKFESIQNTKICSDMNVSFSTKK